MANVDGSPGCLIPRAALSEEMVQRFLGFARNDRAVTLNAGLLGQFHEREQCVIDRHWDTKLRATTGNVSV